MIKKVKNSVPCTCYNKRWYYNKIIRWYQNIDTAMLQKWVDGTTRLDDTIIKTEVEYSINFSEQQQKNSVLQRKQQLFICQYSKYLSI